MDRTFCSRTTCMYIDCSRHQHNAPKGKTISIADLNDGLCFTELTYCVQSDCRKVWCRFHQQQIDTTRPYVITEQDLGCYVGPEGRNRLVAAICRGTQKTNYKCDTVCKAMCGSDGVCAYCSTIADAIEEEFGLIGDRNKSMEMPIL